MSCDTLLTEDNIRLGQRCTHTHIKLQMTRFWFDLNHFSYHCSITNVIYQFFKAPPNVKFVSSAQRAPSWLNRKKAALLLFKLYWANWFLLKWSWSFDQSLQAPLISSQPKEQEICVISTAAVEIRLLEAYQRKRWTCNKHRGPWVTPPVDPCWKKTTTHSIVSLQPDQAFILCAWCANVFLRKS